jgi:Tfp pilus assembly protein PilX
MNKRSVKTYKNQSGAAVLVISISLLIAVTLLLIYAARVGLLDQKISGNEYRHKTAFANAEAGMEQAASFLRATPALHDGNAADGWATCTGSTSIFPCDIAGATQVFATVVVGTSITTSVNTVAAMTGSEAYLIQTAAGTTAVGSGASDDGTGAAIAQVSYAKTELLTPGSIPPLMVPTATLNGNFNIVPDPNGGGPGVPISVWAKTTLGSGTGNWKTCDHGEFKDSGAVCTDTKGDGDSGADWLSCRCDDERSNKDDLQEDIVLYDDADFPDSPFAYVFGAGSTVTAAEIITLKAEIKARAEATGLLLADCSTLEAEFNALGRPALVWVTGDCQPGANSTIGSRSRPIILVIEGEMRINANSEYWGIVVGLDEFVINGGPVFHGSAISENASDLTNGTYYQVYDEDVLSNLRDDTVNTDIAKIAYSWRDF